MRKPRPKPAQEKLASFILSEKLKDAKKELRLSQAELSRREARILELIEALNFAVGIVTKMQQRAKERPLPLLDPADIKRLDEVRRLR